MAQVEKRIGSSGLGFQAALGHASQDKRAIECWGHRSAARRSWSRGSSPGRGYSISVSFKAGENIQAIDGGASSARRSDSPPGGGSASLIHFDLGSDSISALSVSELIMRALRSSLLSLFKAERIPRRESRFPSLTWSIAVGLVSLISVSRVRVLAS